MKNKIGTYTTIDAPTKMVDEAFDFLKVQFELIGGTARRFTNQHDLGEYLSFEIDFPEELTDDLDEDRDGSEDESSSWLAQAYKIEKKYGQIFEPWL